MHTAIAHEPPLEELLRDREELWAQTEDMIATYLAGDRRGAWRQFLKTANIHLPDEVFEAMFGGGAAPAGRLPTSASSSRTCCARPPGSGPTSPPCARAATRVVVGIGEQSGGQLCDRTSRALAAALGIEPTMFPGGHIGFAEDPPRFEARLRELLQS